VARTTATIDLEESPGTGPVIDRILKVVRMYKRSVQRRRDQHHALEKVVAHIGASIEQLQQSDTEKDNKPICGE